MLLLEASTCMIGEVLAWGLLNEIFTVFNFMVGVWTHENSEIKSIAKISTYTVRPDASLF